MSITPKKKIYVLSRKHSRQLHLGICFFFFVICLFADFQCVEEPITLYALESTSFKAPLSILSTSFPVMDNQEIETEAIKETETVKKDKVESKETQTHIQKKEKEKTLHDFISSDFQLQSVLQIIEIEAEGEGYDGKLAVANVILNRVKSSSFPNDFYEVISQNRQFSSFMSKDFGFKDVTQETEDALLDAFLGKNNVGDSLYFCNLSLLPSTSWFFSSDEINFYTKIGEHSFYVQAQ